MKAGLPTHTHVITLYRTEKSGNDTPTVWSYSENRRGNGTVTSSAPNNNLYGQSETVTPLSLKNTFLIRY